jgi:diacylglycerol O-acyltransferase / wax synthase
MASRLAARARLFNFLVTNVPGPQIPIYCLGARLLGAFPFAPLSATQSYGVGVTSIDGWMNVGLTADYDAMPDVEVVTGYLRGALADLLASAEAVDARHDMVERDRRARVALRDEAVDAEAADAEA